MKVNREEFLKVLDRAKIGLTSNETLEQSNAFAFTDGKLITFNEEVLTRQESPLDFDAIVIAEDLLKLVAKFPDEEIEIIKKDDAVRLKGKRKNAGVICQAEVRLPFEEVPQAKKWKKLKKDLFKTLSQASKNCGKDQTQYLTTYVHVTPDYVEATDGYRMFRATEETGFKKSMLIPASCVDKVKRLSPKEYSIRKGWLHLKTKDGCEISVRGSHEDYIKSMDKILKQKNSEEVELPKNLKEILSRAETMNESGHEARVKIRIEEGWLTVRSEKDSGWYEEKKKTSYKGVLLVFECHPELLKDILEKTRTVNVSRDKIKIVADNIQFVIALDVTEKDTADEIPF